MRVGRPGIIREENAKKSTNLVNIFFVILFACCFILYFFFQVYSMKVNQLRTQQLLFDCSLALSIPIAFCYYLLFLAPGAALFLAFIQKHLFDDEDFAKLFMPITFVLSSAVAYIVFWITLYSVELGEVLSRLIFCISIAFLFCSFFRGRIYMHLKHHTKKTKTNHKKQLHAAKNKKGPVDNLITLNYCLGNPKLQLALIFSVGLFYSGLLFIGRIDCPILLQSRNIMGLSSDAELPYTFAKKILDGQSLVPFVGDWLASDRPPLLTAMFIFVEHSSILPPEIMYQFFGTFIQLSWITAAFALFNFFELRTHEKTLFFALTVFNGFFYMHSTFLWPKMQTILFYAVVMIFYYELHDKSDVDHLTGGGGKAALLGLSGALAVLSHGTILFALVGLGLALVFKLRANWRLLLTSLVCFVASYISWPIFQALVDPPGNRLFKWQICGVTNLDQRGSLETLIDSYTEIPFIQILINKLKNFRRYFPDYSDGFQTGILRREEFYTLFAAVGIGALLLLVTLVFKNKRKMFLTDKNKYMVNSLLLSMVITAILLFGPGSAVNHQSPYTHIVLVYLIIAICASYAPRWCSYAIVGYGFIRFMKWMRPPDWVEAYNAQLAIVSFIGLLLTIGLLYTMNRQDKN